MCSSSPSTTSSTRTSTAPTDFPNIKPIIFDTAQAAFLAGYASADFSTTKVVGTYGGKPFPTVTIFMDGFKQGVDYWNEQNGGDVEVLGWDGTDGLFTDAFVRRPGGRERRARAPRPGC